MTSISSGLDDGQMANLLCGVDLVSLTYMLVHQ